ncbi:MAG: energy transducer TonB [Pseudoduganella sp.]|jgi:beta-lactamase regulating signal transducer with metallopeptidase domain|nr:energy transducer TonB [Pseudoduganella sp.]
MASEWLLRFLLASAASSALVLLLRQPLRRLGGAGCAYLLWACVPASMLASLAPRDSVIGQAIAEVTVPASAAAALAGAFGAASGTAAGWRTAGWDGALAVAWLAGALAMLTWMSWRQWAFQRTLRRERWRGGPLLLGAWHARLVLPDDFRQRYDKAERRLVLAHERVHAERGDLVANAACTLLQCLAWCNPLIHIAAARFRLDQELSCDEAVLRRHGQAGTYANAMLKTQLAAQGLPLACQWQAVHPLKERIMHLKSSVSPARRLGGKLAAILLLSASSLGALSAQADTPAAKTYKIHFTMDNAAPRILLQAGETGTVTSGTGADAWSTRVVAAPDGKDVQLKIHVRHGDKEVDHFTLILPEGGHGKFAVSDGPGKDFEVALHVTEQK